MPHIDGDLLRRAKEARVAHALKVRAALLGLSAAAVLWGSAALFHFLLTSV